MAEQKCPRCDGTGTIPCPTCENGMNPDNRDNPCLNCNGTAEKSCPNCEGKGVIRI